MMELQNKFVYPTIFNVLGWKKDKGTEYTISRKSDGVNNYKLITLHGAFLPHVEYFGDKIGIKFNNPNCKYLDRLWFR